MSQRRLTSSNLASATFYRKQSLAEACPCARAPFELPGDVLPRHNPCERARVQFKVYSGTSEDELEYLYSQGSAAWCAAALSWDALFASGVKHCDVTISPFDDTYLAIVPKDYHHANIAAGKANCTYTEHAELSVQLIGTGLAGVVLVATAPLFATSIAFRMSVGGVLSTLLFSLIIAFVMFRCACVRMHVHSVKHLFTRKHRHERWQLACHST